MTRAAVSASRGFQLLHRHHWIIQFKSNQKFPLKTGAGRPFSLPPFPPANIFLA
jgi:hypothetical protein